MWALVCITLAFTSSDVVSSQVFTLTLEKVPSVSTNNFNKLHARDLKRHSMSSNGVGTIHFPINESFDPYYGSSYFTRVNLGTPPQALNLLFDTGSDPIWASCYHCRGCPIRTNKSYFDPRISTTSSLVPCSNNICGNCSTNSRCLYQNPYADGSLSSGYYMSDVIHLDTISSKHASSNSSARINFGCSDYWSGFGALEIGGIDGILGFGHLRNSFISQLSSLGIAPNVFSHCLHGGAIGSGNLIVGEVVEPGMVYSPLIPSRRHYTLNLLSIGIKRGGKLAASQLAASQLFMTRQEAIVDSGTSYAYLPEAIYDPFIQALTDAIPPLLRVHFKSVGERFVYNSSISDLYPVITLNFEGDANMTLKPENYLVQTMFDDIWRIGFQKSPKEAPAILGELVLRDKVIAYDIAHGYLGWGQNSCSPSVNNTRTPVPKNTGFINVSWNAHSWMLATFVLHLCY